MGGPAPRSAEDNTSIARSRGGPQGPCKVVDSVQAASSDKHGMLRVAVDIGGPVVLWMSLLLGAANAGELADAKLVVGAPMSVVITSAGSELKVPACRGVVWEVFDGESEAYVPIPSEACQAGAEPITVGSEPVTVEADVVLPSRAIARAVVLVARDCRPGEAIADAGCEQIEVLETHTITVK